MEKEGERNRGADGEGVREGGEAEQRMPKGDGWPRRGSETERAEGGGVGSGTERAEGGWGAEQGADEGGGGGRNREGCWGECQVSERTDEAEGGGGVCLSGTDGGEEAKADRRCKGRTAEGN